MNACQRLESAAASAASMAPPPEPMTPSNRSIRLPSMSFATSGSAARDAMMSSISMRPPISTNAFLAKFSSMKSVEVRTMAATGARNAVRLARRTSSHAAI
jgi:hypothetical protein